MITEPVRLSSARSTVEGGTRAQPAAAAAPGAAAPAPVPAGAERVAAEQAAAAAADANRRLAQKGSELTIEFDDVLERMVFRLVDSQSGEVVRQIPTEEVLAIARALADNASAGVLLRADA